MPLCHFLLCPSSQQECFNCPYGTEHFPPYAEPVPGETTQAVATVAKECGVYLVGGSIPERAGNKVYNTATAFDRLGQMVAKYRKMHLFDIDIPGKITFKESDTLTGRSELATFDTGESLCVCVRECMHVCLCEHSCTVSPSPSPQSGARSALASVMTFASLSWLCSTPNKAARYSATRELLT